MPSVAGGQAEYIKAAQKAGAVLFISGQELDSVDSESCLKIPDMLQVMGNIVHQTLGSACDKMAVIGITGTNGKSSISFYLAQLLNELRSSLIVTGMTTPPLEQLHLALSELSEQYQAIAMEVSSHGLEQERLAGVNFNGAIFSNLTRDHLDYHGDMATYGAAKARLFNWLSTLMMTLVLS